MRGPGPLHVVIGGLALAGMLKVGVDVSPDLSGLTAVPARVVRMLGAAEAASSAKAPDPAPAPVTASLPVPPVDAAERCEAPEAMAAAIADERKLLDEQKSRLSERATEIELAREGMELERASLAQLKSDVESLLERVDKAYTDDLKRLVSLYRNMKPQVAAGIMDEMDIEVSVMVLGAMPERDAAQIMAALSLVRARAISKIILERSKLPADQDLTGIKLQ